MRISLNQNVIRILKRIDSVAYRIYAPFYIFRAAINYIAAEREVFFMKKQFGKLFIIFGVLICIFALVGCDLVFVNNPDTEKNPAEESDSHEEISDSEEPLADVFEPDEELVKELIDYLQQLCVEYDIGETSLSIKTDEIKKGAQPLQVKFDPDKYYYVCAYHSPECPEEDFLYCHADKYTWVGFSNEKNIAEYYNGVKLWAAFQINKTSLCIDLLPGDRNVPKIEHFQGYTPVFENGVNTTTRLEYKDTFIYLNSSDSDVVYMCSNHILHDFVSIPYIELDGKCYITQHLYTDAPYDGYERRIKWEFGDYYDILTEIMITDKYSVVNKSGRILYYGLFEINEFVDKVLK